MKKCYIPVVCFFFLALGQLNGQIADVYEIRLAAAGGNDIAVQMRCINPTNPCPTTADAILDITFAVKWLNSYGINLSAPISSYGVIRSGVETVQGAYEFQIFQLNAAPFFFPEGWMSGNWYTIATVTASPIGSGTYTFEIAETGFNPSSDPNFNVNGDDYLPAINGFAELSNPLPLELLSFRAYPLGADVALEWTTAHEINSSHFEVERSADGMDFQPIATIKAAGEASEDIAYNTLDENPILGVNYYRLKQVDNDGSYEYAPIVNVEFKAETSIRIYPNPFSSNVQVEILTENGASVASYLFDSTGRLAWQGQLHQGVQSLELPTLPAGVYWLETDLGNRVERVRVVRIEW